MKTNVIIVILWAASCLSSFCGDAETLKQIKQYAAKGNVVAQYELGEIYVAGEYVKQDLSEAIKWYRKAAYQGNVDAYFKLGEVSYVQHQNLKIGGQESSYSLRGRDWYEIAARRGHVEAAARVEALNAEREKKMAPGEKKRVVEKPSKQSGSVGGVISDAGEDGRGQAGSEIQSEVAHQAEPINFAGSKKNEESWKMFNEPNESAHIQFSNDRIGDANAVYVLSENTRRRMGLENETEGFGNIFVENVKSSAMKMAGSVAHAFGNHDFYFAMKAKIKLDHDYDTKNIDSDGFGPFAAQTLGSFIGGPFFIVPFGCLLLLLHWMYLFPAIKDWKRVRLLALKKAAKLFHRIDGARRALNMAQKIIFGAVVLFALLLVAFALIHGTITHFPLRNLDETWWVWLLALACIGGFECYWLKSD